MPNDFAETRITANEAGKPIRLTFWPNDHQPELIDQEIQLKNTVECWHWIDQNWKQTGLEDGSGWMSLSRLLFDGDDTQKIRMSFEALNDEKKSSHFRLVTMIEEDNGVLSFMSFGQASAVCEVKRTKIYGLVRQLLIDHLSADDLYRLFEFELVD